MRSVTLLTVVEITTQRYTLESNRFNPGAVFLSTVASQLEHSGFEPACQLGLFCVEFARSLRDLNGLIHQHQNMTANNIRII